MSTYKDQLEDAKKTLKNAGYILEGFEDDASFADIDIEKEIDLASTVIDSIDNGEINADDFAKEIVLFINEKDPEMLEDFCMDHNFIDMEG